MTRFEALPLVQRVGLFIGDEALFEGLGAQALRIHATPVVVAIRMTMWSPSWRASRRTWDLPGLPAARRSSGDSTP
jgi:hypothetical protein